MYQSTKFGALAHKTATPPPVLARSDHDPRVRSGRENPARPGARCGSGQERREAAAFLRRSEKQENKSPLAPKTATPSPVLARSDHDPRVRSGRENPARPGARCGSGQERREAAAFLRRSEKQENNSPLAQKSAIPLPVVLPFYHDPRVRSGRENPARPGARCGSGQERREAAAFLRRSE